MSEILLYKDALTKSMRDIMTSKTNAVAMGQGINDPTAIFGTTKGLLEEFGKDRVLDVPISEDGMMGFAVGMALNGLYPIQTHIRVDFLVVGMNQLVNIISKYKYMYGGTMKVPMLIRAVVGRSWGQGPQHSQSLQSMLSHVPGLTVIMPSTSDDVINSYAYASAKHEGPVVSIEHRFLYDLKFNHAPDSKNQRHPFSSRLVKSGDDLTIVATSYMVQEAQLAAKWVEEKAGLKVEVIDLHSISHMDSEMILKSVSKTGRLIVADTGWLPYGVPAEVARIVMENDPSALKAPMISLGMKHCPAPTSHVLEKHFYPDMGTLVDSIYSLMSQEKKHGWEIPTHDYVVSLRTKFKGPF